MIGVLSSQVGLALRNRALYRSGSINQRDAFRGGHKGR